MLSHYSVCNQVPWGLGFSVQWIQHAKQLPQMLTATDAVARTDSMFLQLVHFDLKSKSFVFATTR